jgi:hypothetical protein
MQPSWWGHNVGEEKIKGIAAVVAQKLSKNWFCIRVRVLTYRILHFFTPWQYSDPYHNVVQCVCHEKYLRKIRIKFKENTAPAAESDVF